MNINLAHIPPATASLFRKLAGLKYMNRFSLVGGTALSLQLGHRQSEDLDFAYDGEKIDTSGIRRFIAKTFPVYKLIREEIGFQLDFLIDGVKLTFFSTGAVLIPFSVKEHTFPVENLNITDVPTVAALKMATISQRCTIRDYYDLYFIAKNIIPLPEIYQTTRQLFPALPPIIYSETIIYTNDIPEISISNHLNPSEQVTKAQIATWFVEEIKKMGHR